MPSNAVPVLKPREVVATLKTLGFNRMRQRVRTSGFATRMDAPPRFRCMLAGTFRQFFCVRSPKMLGSPAGSSCPTPSSDKTASRNLDRLRADVFGLQLRFSVLQDQRDDLTQVVVQLFERLALAVCAGKPRHIADVQAGRSATFHHGCVNAHGKATPSGVQGEPTPVGAARRCQHPPSGCRMTTGGQRG